MSDPPDVISPAPRDAWASVLEESAEATMYQSPEWLDACCASGGFEDASRLYATRGGRRIVIPIIRPGGRRPLRTARSMPSGWGFGGAIAPGRLSAEDVSAILEDLLNAEPNLVLKPGPLSSAAWAAAPARERVPHCIHVVDLREGFDRLWSEELSSGTRNKVRKAEKQGVEIEWGSASELAGVHWDIYLRWAARRARASGLPVSLGKRLAKRQESIESYEAIARRLGDRCRIAVARLDGEVVASSIVLLDGAHAHYWRSASDQADARSRYANYLLLARVLEEVATRGHEYLEMGESGGVRSLMDFKEHFGGRPRTYDVLLFGSQALTKALRARDHMVSGASRLTRGAFSRLGPRRGRAGAQSR